MFLSTLNKEKINKYFGYSDNAIRNRKVFNPITHDSVAYTVMVVLTNKPLPCRKRSKKE